MGSARCVTSGIAHGRRQNPRTGVTRVVTLRASTKDFGNSMMNGAILDLESAKISPNNNGAKE
jgi:hypothetical protein